jgi:hypothetical protein
MRAQANLPALGVALLVVSAAVGVGLAVTDGAFAGATRESGERRTTVALSERLVSAESPLTLRRNVLNRSGMEALDAATLRERFPVAEGVEFRVRLDGETVAAAGDATGGVTMRRVVLVSERQTVGLTPAFTGANATVTLPRRAGAATLTIDPAANATVRTVRANGRVVLHDPGGLAGSYRVRLSRLETTRLRFETADGDALGAGDVTVTYAPRETAKATLEVTVDA